MGLWSDALEQLDLEGQAELGGERAHPRSCCLRAQLWCEGHIQFCSASLGRRTCAHFGEEIAASAAGPKVQERDHHEVTWLHWGLAAGAHCPRLFTGDLVGIFC